LEGDFAAKLRRFGEQVAELGFEFLADSRAVTFKKFGNRMDTD
jgi:hypothetical protein